MKVQFLKLNFFAILIASLVFISSCNDDDDNVQPDNLPEEEMEDELDITGIALSDDNFSSLVAALTKADLVTTLQGDGPFTVFAPTNDAFTTFLSDNGFAGLDDVPVDVLTQVLLNHVVSGKAMSTDLSAGYISTLATEATSKNNISLLVDLSDGVMLNGTSKVTTADVMATNGVVHVVDAVIGVPNVVQKALANENFSILVAALTREDMDVDYVSILSGEGPFTVFAPTNDAFVNLLSELGAASLNDIPLETLKAVLNYHVIAGANVLSSSLSDGQEVIALNDGKFTINIESSSVFITDANGRDSNIVATDVQGGNGVIHVIDNVILP